MGIRDALASAPAKPVIATAIGMTILVAGWHGWNVRDICTRRANLSEALHDWTKSVFASSGGGSRLDSITEFDWDQIRISQGKESLGPGRSCPFVWHWSNTARSQMAQKGHLTLIGFFKDDRLVQIADFDRRWAQFDTGEEPIARQRAIFKHVTNTNMLRVSDP